MTRLSRYALRAVLAAAVVVVLAVAGVRLWAPQRQQAADRGWAESFESMEALLARYPSAPDSPAAMELADLAQRLGISMHTAPAPETGPEEVRRLQPLVTFVAAQAAKADDDVLEAPPPEVAEFLSGRAAEIDAVEARLLGRDPIAWAIDIRQGAGGPIPSLLGFRYLQSVLLARALVAARRGDAPAAQRALEASWRLNLAVRERPELICQLIAIAVDDLHDGVLRRVPAVPVEWAERVSSQDWRRALLRSYQAEALLFSITARNGGVTAFRDRATGPVSLISRAGAVLFLEWSIADYSEQMRRMAVELRQQDACAVDTEAVSRRTEDGLSRWNMLGRVAVPGLARSWDSAARAALGDELTRLVVLSRTPARAPASGAVLPAAVPSTVCAGLTWAVKTLPSGDIQIEADRNPFKSPTPTPLLAFRVHRVPARRP
jgi:hypothetical protein